MSALASQIGFALWRLLPGNPIVVRVVRGGSKSVPHLWVRTGYLLVLFLLVLILSVGLSTGSSLSQRAKQSTSIFEWVSILQLSFTCLLAPIFTASAISQERDAETFNVLLTTPLTNAQIALGSLVSRLFFVIALLLSGLPIFCITMLFGGVTADRIFVSFGIAACTALLAGSLAILISVTRIGTRGTIFSFYMGFALFVLVGFALGMWNRTYVPESVVATKEGMSWLTPFHPFLALFVALRWIQVPDKNLVQHYPWPLPSVLSSPDTAYMIFTLLFSFVLIAVSTIFVRMGARQSEPLWPRLWRRLRGTAADGERRQRARRVWANPVAWREAITRASISTSGVVRYTFVLGGIAAAICLLIAYANKSFISITEARTWLSAIVIIEFVTVLFMTTNSAATAITREREAGTMELLLATPLTSRYIVWGKLRGLLSFALRLQLIPALTVFAAAIYSLIFERNLSTPLMELDSAILLLPLLFIYSALACVIGLHMSLRNTRSLQAVLVSVGTLIIAGFVLYACGLAATSGFGQCLTPFSFVYGIWLVLNPNAASQEPILLLFGTVLAIVVYGVIVLTVYKAMVKNFDMIVRKQSR